jgi:hypothetical protein
VPRKATRTSAEAPIEATRRQILAFRIERAGLGRRSRDVTAAAGELGLPDFPPGAAVAALAPRLAAPTASVIPEAFEERRLVRLRAMRGAPVVARADDYDLLVAAMLPPDERSMRAFIGPAARTVDAAKMSAVDAVSLVAEKAGRALANGPLDRDAVHAELRRSLPKGLLPYCRPCDSHHAHPSLLYAAALAGRWVIFPRDEGPYIIARADRWFGRRASRPGGATPGAAGELVRRFLRHYGPATTAEFAAWAGVGGGQPQAAWAEVAGELAPVRVEGAAARVNRFLLAADVDELAAGEGGAGVRLLSPGDPLLQMRDRDTLVPDREAQQIIWKNLAPSGVVLAGSEVAGIVRIRKQRSALELSVSSLRKIDAPTRAAVESEAARLAAARGVADVRVVWS